MKKFRLVVIDDHALFRAGLINLLQEMNEFEVVGEGKDGISGLKVVSQTLPDVVLLDVNMPGMGGIETVRALRSFPSTQKCRVLMLTISKNEQDLIGALQAGADGYILKSAEPDELRNAIIQVQQGMAVLSPQVTRQVIQALQREGNQRAEPLLSERELEVLRCLAEGLTTMQTADQLVISENTVKTHVRHILEKLEASNRAEAVNKAVRLGLIKSIE